MKFLSFKHIAVYALLTASLASCDLEVVPPAEIASQTFWKTEKDAWYALNSCYAQLPGMDIWDEMYTDNAHSHKPWEGPYELLQQDAISAANDFGYDFSTIRIANNFLKNVDKCEMSDALKSRMKAEAQFFRAWNYLQLTTKFGKVAIVTDVLDYNAPNVARDPVEAVQAFILSELKNIAEVLPDSYDGSYLYESGRITRAAALSLRARAALYFGNFAEAEISATLVITEGHHKLFRVTALNAAQEKEAKEMEQYIDFDAYGINKDQFLKGLFSYETLWHKSNAKPQNPEYILTRQYMADENNADWTRYTYMRPSQLRSGYSSFEPMQDLVDAYWDADGKTIRPLITKEKRQTDYVEMWKDFTTRIDSINTKGERVVNYIPFTQSKYIEEVGKADIKKYEYMKEFRNRDSRLYASILFPFKGWHETDFSTFYFRWNPQWAGNDGNESYSGYNYRKLVALTPYQDSQGVEDFPIIRYAEVLLTYAEARIQNVGWDSKIQEQLNDLRDRCGMPKVPTTMGGKQAALDFVRNERRIELAAEGHRYDDIRRYGKEYCAKVMNGTTYAPSGSFTWDKAKEEEKWNSYEVINKAWGDRLMLMPLPQSAMDTNPLLVTDQNPGY